MSAKCRSANFSEGEGITDIENKGYDGKSLIKKGKSREEILATFNAENPTGVKRDMKILQGCWKR